jgi:hypothetical protein
MDNHTHTHTHTNLITKTLLSKKNKTGVIILCYLIGKRVIRFGGKPEYILCDLKKTLQSYCNQNNMVLTQRYIDHRTGYKLRNKLVHLQLTDF